MADEYRASRSVLTEWYTERFKVYWFVGKQMLQRCIHPFIGFVIWEVAGIRNDDVFGKWPSINMSG